MSKLLREPDAVLWVLSISQAAGHAGAEPAAAGFGLVKHLPLFFDLAGRRVVVVGEGAAADRRADLVRSAGADVRRVVSPTVEPSDFRGAVAAFIATGDADRDAAAQWAAKSIGVPVNVADRPALCDFILPAIVDRDEIVVAVSTGGASRQLWLLFCAPASRRRCPNAWARWRVSPPPSAPR